MTGQRPGETYRASIAARRPSQFGGGPCSLLVRRIGGRVELIFHGATETAAELPDELAAELVNCVTAARDPNATRPRR